jgi:hypothetical protein
MCLRTMVVVALLGPGVFASTQAQTAARPEFRTASRSLVSGRSIKRVQSQLKEP